MLADLDARSEAWEKEAFGIWPQNWPIVTAFTTASSQWRVVGLGEVGLHWIGLDYAGVRAGLDLAGIALTPDEWTGLRVMERAAAEALNGVKG